MLVPLPLLCLLLLGRASAANVSYDGRALLIDGERRLLAAGSIHYARSTPEMWPVLMGRAKEAGIDVITTYVFWNLHEVSHDDSTGAVVYDFSTGRRNLSAFLEAASSAGLYVFVRLGPFACAEWTYGGIPTRLRGLTSNYSSSYSSAPRVTFRSWDPAWRREMAAFVTRTVQEIRPYLAVHGGPVVMLQPENEYGNIEQYYGPDGPKYAQWAADLVLGLQTGLPVAMCGGRRVRLLLVFARGAEHFVETDVHAAIAFLRHLCPYLLLVACLLFLVSFFSLLCSLFKVC